MKAEDITRDLRKIGTKERGLASARFFKTGKGHYGEGEIFCGVTVPEQRNIAKRYRDLSFAELYLLIADPIHEARLIALLILVDQYKRGRVKEKKKIVDWYLAHSRFVNNWDLVDSSAYQILGDWLLSYDYSPLLDYAKSKSLWKRRIAIVSTYAFIRYGNFAPTLIIAEMLLSDTEDLLHKATGWMLREVGKRSAPTLENFLDKHGRKMPRTCLRYAIEKFSPEKRAYYLSKSKI